MMRERLTESAVESAALSWLESLGWAVKHGPEIAPDAFLAGSAGYSEVVLTQRMSISNIGKEFVPRQ